MVKKIVLLCSLLVFALCTYGQKPFATVSLNRTYAFEQQPIKATIKVYSPTWFTDGLEFGELKVNGAFIIPFTNSVAGNEIINNHSYAMITYYYLVFPYKVGELEFPELEMTAFIPPKGDFEGKPTTLRTSSKVIHVRSLPASDKPAFVANSAYLNDYWNKDFKNLKVGDVLERTVTVTGFKTIANFIPSIAIDSVTYAKRYLNSNLTDQQIDNKKETLKSTRTEKYSYLFTKAGDYEMPGSEITYFNPFTGKYKTVRSKAMKIHVDTSSNLGIVGSIADSLAALQPSIATDDTPKVPLKEQIIEFIVEHKYQLLAVVIFLIVYKRLFRLLRILLFRMKEKRRMYLLSEGYAFKKALQKSRSKNPYLYLQRVYNWLLHTQEQQVSITQQAKEVGDEKALKKHQELFKALNSEGIKNVPSSFSSFSSVLIHLRNRIQNLKKKRTSKLEDWD
ncbi:BatD family protein [Flammeovirga kamogawensis]|uniref:BatD family protein n=1 Tax=Flammeovirga kamogawensis TaxID=373891 RepID=A0ABX8GZ34_9BACT|nr:BatD family protein [Flammeovirga kamogawensis]MBB6459319.1 hypothetical protein [Flammeovirga kamogawensis]QWG08878.1 BatD family protein [Flammeovirga kamogawensis]TRX67168.1 protein BatD [Flammeovirga kamogawensis]